MTSQINLPIQIRPIPLHLFEDSLLTISSLNESINKALNSLEPDQHFVVLGVATSARQELVAIARAGNDWTFSGFLNHMPETGFDYGVTVRFAPHSK